MKNLIKVLALSLVLALSVSFISCSDEPKETSDSELATAVDEQEPDESEAINALLNPAGTLPTGSSYHINVDGKGVYTDIFAGEDGTTEFPAEVTNSDIFRFGDYEYSYTDGAMFNGVAGWTVTVAADSKEEAILTAVLESINGIPVVSMNACFKDCAKLQYAPAIPDTVVTMTHAFDGCAALTTAPVIPESVKNFDSAFYGCLSLQGEVEINATPETFADCFTATGYELTITGSCQNKADLAATGIEGMITY